MKSVLFPYSVYSIFIFLYTVLKNVDSFSNETPLCCSETHNSSAVALIRTIFVSEIEQKQSIFGHLILTYCLFKYYCIKSVSNCNHADIAIWGNIMAV